MGQVAARIGEAARVAVEESHPSRVWAVARGDAERDVVLVAHRGCVRRAARVGWQHQRSGPGVGGLVGLREGAGEVRPWNHHAGAAEAREVDGGARHGLGEAELNAEPLPAPRERGRHLREDDVLWPRVRLPVRVLEMVDEQLAARQPRLAGSRVAVGVDPDPDVLHERHEVLEPRRRQLQIDVRVHQVGRDDVDRVVAVGKPRLGGLGRHRSVVEVGVDPADGCAVVEGCRAPELHGADRRSIAELVARVGDDEVMEDRVVVEVRALFDDGRRAFAGLRGAAGDVRTAGVGDARDVGEDRAVGHGRGAVVRGAEVVQSIRMRGGFDVIELLGVGKRSLDPVAEVDRRLAWVGPLLVADLDLDVDVAEDRAGRDVVEDERAPGTRPVEDGLAVHVLVAERGRRASRIAVGGVVEDLEVVADVDAERIRARSELEVDVIADVAVVEVLRADAADAVAGDDHAADGLGSEERAGGGEMVEPVELEHAPAHVDPNHHETVVDRPGAARGANHDYPAARCEDVVALGRVLRRLVEVDAVVEAGDGQRRGRARWQRRRVDDAVANTGPAEHLVVAVQNFPATGDRPHGLCRVAVWHIRHADRRRGVTGLDDVRVQLARDDRAVEDVDDVPGCAAGDRHQQSSGRARVALPIDVVVVGGTVLGPREPHLPRRRRRRVDGDHLNVRRDGRQRPRTVRGGKRGGEHQRAEPSHRALRSGVAVTVRSWRRTRRPPSGATSTSATGGRRSAGASPSSSRSSAPSLRR